MALALAGSTRLPSFSFSKCIKLSFSNDASAIFRGFNEYKKLNFKTFDTLLSSKVQASISSTIQNNATILTSSEDPISPSSFSVTPSWESFSLAISGEWDGYCAEFDRNGKPVELPEIVVPQAYRDWGIQLYAWQMQCPTLAQPSYQLYTRLMRLVATVGCEADAATVHDSAERVAGSESNSEVLAFKTDGCYCTAPFTISPNSPSGSEVPANNSVFLRIEHCFVLETTGTGKGTDAKKVRTRIVHHLQRGKDDAMDLIAKKTEVFKETWYDEFKDGASIGGCASNDSPFVDHPPLKSNELCGKWLRKTHSIPFSSNSANPSNSTNLTDLTNLTDSSNGVGVNVFELNQIESDGVEIEVEDDFEFLNFFFLPKDVWSRVACINGGDAIIESGWKVNENLMVKFSSIYDSNGVLKEISMESRTRVL